VPCDGFNDGVKFSFDESIHQPRHQGSEQPAAMDQTWPCRAPSLPGLACVALANLMDNGINCGTSDGRSDALSAANHIF
jgi:hypothetical protein